MEAKARKCVSKGWRVDSVMAAKKPRTVVTEKCSSHLLTARSRVTYEDREAGVPTECCRTEEGGPIRRR